MSHPFQRAKRFNLDRLTKLYHEIYEKAEDKEEAKQVLRSVFIKLTGCSFRKLKEYCEDLALGIVW